MGNCGSNPSAFDIEQKSIEEILDKNKDTLTTEERNRLEKYVSTYSEVVIRIQKALDDIEKRLSGVDPDPEPEPEYVPTVAEKAQARLSSVMRGLKRELKKYDSAIAHFRQLAKENRANEDVCRDYLKIVQHCQKASETVDSRMEKIEGYLSQVREAEMALDQVVLMNELADNLEAVQKSMGTVEDYERTMDSLKDIDSNLKECNVALNEEAEEDDGDLDSYMDALDKELAAENTASALPSAPSSEPNREKAKEPAKRVAELE
ncbi:hypothetical protein WA538_002360 [Blastocystis sp. DL]